MEEFCDLSCHLMTGNIWADRTTINFPRKSRDPWQSVSSLVAQSIVRLNIREVNTSTVDVLSNAAFEVHLVLEDK
jgi:hypothetical protein